MIVEKESTNEIELKKHIHIAADEQPAGTVSTSDSQQELPNNTEVLIEEESSASSQAQILKDLNESNTHPTDSSPTLASVETSDLASSGSTRSKVSFSNVRVHTHRMSLGDNPSTSHGVPVTLAWEVDESNIYDLEEFEKTGTRKGPSRIPKACREAIASERHSRNSIVQAESEVKKIQEWREESSTDNRRRQRKPAKRRGLFSFFRRR